MVILSVLDIALLLLRDSCLKLYVVACFVNRYGCILARHLLLSWKFHLIEYLGFNDPRLKILCFTSYVRNKFEYMRRNVRICIYELRIGLLNVIY